MSKLRIDRKTWLRGEGAAKSRLLRSSDGKMCCLGFYGISCDVPLESLRDRQSPWHVSRAWPEQAAWLEVPLDDSTSNPNRPTPDCSELMIVNDDWNRNDAEREAEIITIFAKHDVEVEFF
jgi:hypothetical protein